MVMRVSVSAVFVRVMIAARLGKPQKPSASLGVVKLEIDQSTHGGLEEGHRTLIEEAIDRWCLRERLFDQSEDEKRSIMLEEVCAIVIVVDAQICECPEALNLGQVDAIDAVR